MASSKVMVSSNSRNSDLQSSRRPSSSSSARSLSNLTKIHSDSTMTVDGHLRNNLYNTSNPSPESTLLDAQITLIDTPAIVPNTNPKTVDDVWREIVSGERKECKLEVPDEMMTLEDFLAKAGAVEEEDIKLPPQEKNVFGFDPNSPSSFQALDNVEGSIIGFGNGVEVMGGDAGGDGGSRWKGKRGRSVFEPLDKVAQQRQRRMIKNRESAARSRERKQAYQVELESLAVRLEEENEMLMKEKEAKTKERFKQLMQKVVPVVEKRRPPRSLRRVQSMEW